MHKILSIILAIIAVIVGAVVWDMDPVRASLIGASVFAAYWSILGWCRSGQLLRKGPVMITYCGGRAKPPAWSMRGAAPQSPLRPSESNFLEMERRAMEEIGRIGGCRELPVNHQKYPSIYAQNSEKLARLARSAILFSESVIKETTESQRGRDKGGPRHD